MHRVRGAHARAHARPLHCNVGHLRELFDGDATRGYVAGLEEDLFDVDVLAAMRRRGDGRPVLIITARDAVADRVAGLDAGADDYMVKPFDLDELAARVRALVRRRAGRAQPKLAHGALLLDPATREVTRAGVPVALSPREFALLEALMMRPGAVLSRAQLEDRLYGWSEPVESNAVEVHLHGLRRKIGAQAIRNVRGVGWTLAPAGEHA
jgi:two-component system response regulator QseB